ncbi:MAG: hypothetical protein MN733_37425, partial [Nitrososphaera sp.]|nr:hypothetical protein [Nitrososphaera sp.]
RRSKKSHLSFAFDQARSRMLVIAPHLLEGRPVGTEERKHLRLLDAALAELRELRAGSAGLLKLEPSTICEDADPLFAPSKTWVTQTKYRPTRHAKKMTGERAILSDVMLELQRRTLPVPKSIKVIDLSQGPKGGLSAHLKLEFAVAIRGPLLLGRTFSFGGGLFVGTM